MIFYVSYCDISHIYIHSFDACSSNITRIDIVLGAFCSDITHIYIVFNAYFSDITHIYIVLDACYSYIIHIYIVLNACYSFSDITHIYIVFDACHSDLTHINKLDRLCVHTYIGLAACEITHIFLGLDIHYPIQFWRLPI